MYTEIIDWHMGKHKHLRNQAGDTIVEVLIAVAVVSSVLVGAFIVTQKSVIAVRNSQEQSEMLQILQGQVELVRGIALSQTDHTNGVYTKNSPFCIDNSDTSNPTRRTFLGAYPANRTNDSYSPTVYPAVCRSIQNIYNVAASYDGDVFMFTGRWDGTDGQKKQVQLFYRIQ